MKTIFPLPDHLVAKIAAGEVIERPAYAIKELIDNSLDAGASEIVVEITEAGLKQMIVTDNGRGMSKEDLLESFKIHTTSKIRSDDTLSAISTLGFRGEALSSIGAISTLTIFSRTAKQLTGFLVEVEQGRMIKSQPIGMPVGTKVTVSNLFFNVPARQKFLKSSKTEMKHIISVVSDFGLAYPQVRFKLIHNSKEAFDLLPQSDTQSRLKAILGNQFSQKLLPVNFEDSYLKISGFISPPEFGLKFPTKQFIFINSRRVSDKMISLAVREAFGSLLPADHYPNFLLFLKTPFEILDINVHPRKEQVSFYNPQMIFDGVKQAVLQTLNEFNLTFGNANFKSSPITGSFAGQVLKSDTNPWTIKPHWPSLKLSQIHNLYIVAEVESGLILVDQHAAHERILFEQFLAEFNLQKNSSQSYQIPRSESLELSLSDFQLLADNLDHFEKIGFKLEPQTGTTFKLTHIPQFFKDHNLVQLLNEILEDLKLDIQRLKVDQFSLKLLQYLACRTAIKAGDKLTENQMSQLLQKLDDTPNNLTCPHGRPTKIVISKTELGRWFKRN